LNEYSRKWSAKNRDKRKLYEQNWRANNPDKVRAIGHNQRARKHSAKGTHTASDIRAIYAHQNGRCYYCGQKVGEDYHVDHVVPLSRGGTNDPSNLVIACTHCNLSKNDKLPHEWPEGGKLL